MINADQTADAYWIQLRGLGECGIRRAQQLAILRYARGPYQPSTPAPTYDVGLPQGIVSIDFNSSLTINYRRFIGGTPPKSKLYILYILDKVKRKYLYLVLVERE